MRTITNLIPNMNQLVTTGICTILIDVSTPFDLPITSSGVNELRDRLIYERPVAPSRPLVIKADSDIGRELNLKEDTVKLVADENNKHYKDALTEYELDFMWLIVIQGIDMNFTDDDGNIITDFDEKKAILNLNGISISNLNHLFDSIIKLGEHETETIEEYVSTTIGLTEAITKKLKVRSRKNKSTPTTGLYNELSIMAEYKISPKEWGELSTVDKSLLNHQLLLKYNMESEMIERQQRENKLETNKQKVMGKLPVFGGRGA